MEEVIKVEWPQLPQRATWTTEAVVSNRAGDSKRPATATGLRPVSSAPGKQPGGWEYLDHTADVQIHSWGATLADAFAAVVVGMFGYMVELEEISVDQELDLEVEGHDVESLLYNFMDECLYIFHTEGFAMRHIAVSKLDLEKFRVKAVAKGGSFDAQKHSQGTEVKAITYSNMQIVRDEPSKAETFVIVDI